MSLASERLRSRGVDVSDPATFEDVGFVAHLKDPNGLVIELLQRTFEENFVKPPVQEDKPLGNPAHPVLGTSGIFDGLSSQASPSWWAR